MVAYIIEISNSKYPFFSYLSLKNLSLKEFIRSSCLSTVQQEPHTREIYILSYIAIIKYEHGKAQSAYYLAQLMDLKDLDDRQQE